MRICLVIISGVFLCYPVAAAYSSTALFYQEATTRQQNSPSETPPGVVGGVGVQAPVRSGVVNPGAGSTQTQAPQGRTTTTRTVPTPPATAGNGTVEPSTPAPPRPAPKSPEASSDGSGRGVKFNFSDAPIDRVIHSIMQELGYSYVIDPQVQGTVNIFTMREVPREKLFEVLEQLLKMNGQAILKQEEIYVIVPIAQGPSIPHGVLMNPKKTRSEEPDAESPQEPASETPEVEELSAGGGSEDAAGEESLAEKTNAISIAASTTRIDEQGVVTFVIPLHYIPSEQMLQMVQAFLSPGATVVDFQPANMILLTDYRKNIEQVLSLVEFLDTQYFSTNTVDLVPIRFNQATEVAEDLGKIFAPGDQAAGVRIVAIERLNSILVITRSAEVFQEVNKWIVKLDSPSATSNMKTSVYQVENNTAVQIAQILAELYQDGFGLPSTQTGDTGERTGSQSSGLDQTNRVPTREPGFVSGSQFDQRGYGQSGFGGSAFGGASGGAMGMRQLGPALSSSSQSQIRGIVAGNVKIVVNEFNNSLIIQGTEADIQFILDTVRQLDTLPRQVVIEAQIYSVELRDELSFGVAAFLQESGAGDIGDGTTGSVGPATTAQVGTDPAGQLTVITRAVIGAERELQAILNALRAKTNVEIVEAPRVLAMDGTPASINIGAEVPVTSASFGNPLQSGTTSFVNSIQFRPTGTTLMIVPRISASGIVTMDLVLEISSATGPALTPTINRNYIQSSFIVGDGQTVGIAGLISDSYNLSRNRVPLLGDIPILGALFGQTSRDERRAELIIFITPRVIRNLPTATEMTLDFKRALRDSYEFINTQQEKEAALVEERRQKELEEVEP